jgi:REP element-mobilizing transposase RayT
MHFVWATYERMPLILDGTEDRLYRCLANEAAHLKCDLLAICGMPDHVHVAVMFPATVTFSAFAKQLKGASSHAMKATILPPESQFAWQVGYGAYAFHARLIDRVVHYIQNQRVHHADDARLWPSLEQTDEIVDGPTLASE